MGTWNVLGYIPNLDSGEKLKLLPDLGILFKNLRDDDSIDSAADASLEPTDPMRLPQNWLLLIWDPS